MEIASKEKCTNEDSIMIIYLSALLHDVADPKYQKVNNIYEDDIKEFLKKENIPNIKEIINVIKNVSFKKELKTPNKTISKETKIVQDADRIDAIGAVGYYIIN